MKKVLLTGDRPTGKLHIGHYVGSLENRVRLQETNEYESYIMIADSQALTDNARNPQKVRDNVKEVALDYLAVGLDPNKCTFFIQSQVPELTEISFYFMNLVTVSRLQRNPTVKNEIAMRNFEASIPVGFFTYPISQAGDILGMNADVVPAGEDQKPMLEQAREIANTFNNTYGELFKMPEIILPSSELARRLPGLDGNSKMSKSLNNCIYISDDEDVLKQKVMSMYTDPNHIKVSDPGKVEGNMVFLYLDIFADDKEKVKEMKEHYSRGGLGDVACKKYLFEVLNNKLKPMRERRKYYEERIDEVMDMLKKGSEKARQRYQEVLKQMKHKIGIDYFD